MSKYRSLRVGYVTKDSHSDQFVHLLIATPGSLLLYFEENQYFDKRSIKCLIIDELELQLSSDENLRKIKTMIHQFQSTNCQFQFYSNCFGENSLDFIKRYVNKHVLVFDWLNHDCLDNFYQFYCYNENRIEKYLNLVRILKRTPIKKVIIYVASKERANFVYKDLRFSDGFKNVMILSSKTNVEERLKVNNAFNSSERAILVMNYPLLLGIQSDDLSMVINFNFPNLKSRFVFHEYFHKIAKCKFDKPTKNIVINMIDNDTFELVERLEKFFRIQMIELDAITDSDHKKWTEFRSSFH